MSVISKTVADLKYVELLFIIILGWILISLWQRCLDNVAYRSLGLNAESTFHTFVVATVSTSIFLAFILSFDSILGNLIETEFGGGNVIAPIVDGSTENIQTIQELEKKYSCYQCPKLF